MLRCTTLLGLLTALWATLPLAVSTAQSDLPDGWDLLPADQFAQVAAPVWSDNSTDTAVRSAIEAQSARLLVEGDAAQNVSDYRLVAGLLRMGQAQLEPLDLDGILIALESRSEGDPSYDNIRSKIAALFLAGASYADRAALLATTLDSYLDSDFEQIPPEDWPWVYNQLSCPQLNEGEVVIEWNGFVTAPASGRYVFSVSPIDINATFGSYRMRHSMSVDVADNEVLSATPESWEPEGSGVELRAGEPTKLRVRAAYSCYKPPINVMHAVLLWEGPGVTKSLVPADALSPPEGDATGLLGNYRLTFSGAAQTVQRIDPGIDFAWPTGRRIVPTHRRTLERAISRMIAQISTDAFLGECVESLGTDSPISHPFLYEPALMAESLTSTQRSLFMNKLLAHPGLVRALSFTELHNFYMAMRLGTPEEAFEVVALWCREHRDLSCSPPDYPSQAGFFDTNRFGPRHLAIGLADQYRPHMERLQDEVLVGGQGSCSLPAAYTLAYCHAGLGSMDEWIALLEEELSDPSLAGDRRVNWLLARAQAEEVRRTVGNFYRVVRESIRAGNGWLDEADLVADSPGVRERVAKERIARMLATAYWDQADTAISDAGPGLAGWSTEVTRLQEAAAQRKAVNEERVALATIAELRRRRQIASDRGDSDSVTRYDVSIQALEDAQSER